MKLIQPNYNLSFENLEHETYVLIVESPFLFTHIVSELKQETEDGEGLFVLSQDEIILNLSKTMKFIINPFDLNSSSKTICNAINKQLSNIAINEYHYEETNKVLSMLENYSDNLAFDFNGIIKQKMDLNINQLIKLFSFEPDINNGTLNENIYNYIYVHNKYLDYSLFCFVNIFNYLDMQEIKILIENCKNIHVTLLFIEAKDIFVDSKLLKKIIIDKDLCQF